MCTRPLHFFRSDVPDEDGKYPGFITGYQQEFADYRDFERRGIPSTLGIRTRYISVPCGSCPECRKAAKKRWVGRCLAEMETCKYTYFFTLTMNDYCVHDVCKEDVQKFLKRFRKKYKCRYLFVGEYGNLSNRPHYHAIIFMNEPLDDLTPINRNKSYPLYRSDFIDSIWYYGFASVGICSADAVAYTVGYITSKEKKTAFKLQSQGLGAQYFKDLKERYILANGRGKEVLVYLPRYLKQKYDLDFGYNGEIQEISWHNKLANSGLQEEEFRAFSEWLSESGLNQ